MHCATPTGPGNRQNAEPHGSHRDNLRFALSKHYPNPVSYLACLNPERADVVSRNREIQTSSTALK